MLNTVIFLNAPRSEYHYVLLGWWSFTKDTAVQIDIAMLVLASDEKEFCVLAIFTLNASEHQTYVKYAKLMLREKVVFLPFVNI